MSESGLPSDLVQALHDLAEQPEPTAEPFERVARWRRACGDAEAAATWQTWSLLPPDEEKLRNALATIWSDLGELDQARALLTTASDAESQPSWLQLTLLVRQGEFERASAMQQQLLKSPPSVERADLLDLLRLWRENQCSSQALELLDPLLGWIKQRGETPTIQVCLALADLLEQQHRFDEAEPWWQRSHAMQPSYAWPLMRLGQQALRKKQPAVAFHYASQVLERNPDHNYAPRLQRKALTALEATRSLALLDGQPLSELDNATGGNQPEPEWWDGCTSLALIGFDSTSLLSSWCGYLNSLDPGERCHPSLRLWLIGSPDPLWLQQKAEDLLAPLPQPVLISSWPIWDEQRHGGADKKLEAIDKPPFWREQEQG